MQCLRALTDAAGDAIVSSDADGHIVDWNPAAERAFGLRRDEALGRPIEELLGGEARQLLRDRRAHLAAGGTREPSCELTGLRRSGEGFPLELALSTWEREGQRFYTAIMRDVSRRRATERQLEALFELVVDLLSGHVLEGRYSLERRVRREASCALYEAFDLEQRVPVMVRVLRALWPEGEREVTLPGPHTHAAEILAVGVTELGIPYAVMEPLSGERVIDRLARGRAIGFDEARAWSATVAETLARVHDQGDAHGRLSAASLFLQRADTAAQSIVVLDFELRHLVPPDSETCRVPAAFCAPEVADGAAPTTASDIYAYAVTLAVLFAGAMPPAPGAEPALLEWAIDAVPPPLAPLMRRALSHQPLSRPSARAFADAIAAIGTRCV